MRRFILSLSLLIFVGCIFCGVAIAKRTLYVLMPIGGGYTIEDQQAIAKKYEELHPDVEIKMEFVGWAALWDKIITSIAAGNAPDVMYIGSRWIPALADMGAIVPLDKYITYDKVKMYHKTVWDTVTYKGKVWGVVRAMSTKVFIYNKKLFREAGITKVPTTWDELLEAARLIREKTGAYGIALAGAKFVSTVTQFQHFLYGNGARIVDENGKVVINSPEAVEALDFYARKLMKYAQPNPVEWRREDLIKLFEAGKVGMYIDHVHNARRALKKGIDVGFFLIPSGPKGETKYVTTLVTDCMSISSQCRDKELAWDFINFMTSFEMQKEWDLKLGFVPPIKKEAELKEFKVWYWKPYIEAIKYGVPEAIGIKDWEGTQEAILDAIHKVILGKAEPKEALDQAARIIEILQR